VFTILRLLNSKAAWTGLHKIRRIDLLNSVFQTRNWLPRNNRRHLRPRSTPFAAIALLLRDARMFVSHEASTRPRQSRKIFGSERMQKN
jgi:hypothetical protein